MKYRKKREIWGYLLQIVFWSLWALWSYRNLLFCSVPGLNGDQSLCLLRGLIAAGASMGFLFTFWNRRNGLNIFVGIACPVGIYYMISLWKLERERIASVMGWTHNLAACYVVLVVIQFIRDRVTGKTHARPWKCAFGCFIGVRTIAALGMTVLLAGTCIDLLPMDVARQRELSTRPGIDRSSHSQLIERNIDSLLPLQPNVWRTLDLDQRLEVLRIAAQIECDAWGIPQVRVRAMPMDADTLGAYEHTTRTVILSLEHLAFDEHDWVLNTLCHETLHAYQHCLVDLYQSLDAREQELALFHDVSVYAYEFDHYINGSDEDATFADYFTQKCEADSYVYAARAVTVYYNAIYAHLEERELEEVMLE